MIKPSTYDKWIEALESGKYKQNRETGCLREPKNNTYCCLGVLHKVKGVSNQRLDHRGLLPLGKTRTCFTEAWTRKSVQTLIPKFFMDSLDKEQVLAYWNDTLTLTFKQIARKLRTKKWREFFLGEGK